MKIIKLVVLCSALLLLMDCNDNQTCYYCYALQGQFIAIHGTDSIRFVAVSKSSISDSVIHYTNLGFVIDTIQIFDYQVDPGKICGTSGYGSAINRGDTCILAR